MDDSTDTHPQRPPSIHHRLLQHVVVRLGGDINTVSTYLGEEPSVLLVSRQDRRGAPAARCPWNPARATVEIEPWR